MACYHLNQYVRKIETVKCQMKKNQHAFENSTRYVKLFCNNYIHMAKPDGLYFNELKLIYMKYFIKYKIIIKVVFQYSGYPRVPNRIFTEFGI